MQEASGRARVTSRPSSFCESADRPRRTLIFNVCQSVGEPIEPRSRCGVQPGEAAFAPIFCFNLAKKAGISLRRLREIPEALYQIPGNSHRGSIPLRALFLYIE